MKRSESRILTTHTGSLPRSLELQELLRQREERQPLDPSVFAAGVCTGVADVVRQQLDTGLDVINDGEQSKSQYAAYVKEWLTGFEGERLIRSGYRLGDEDFPEYVAKGGTHQSSTSIPQPTCTGPIAWKDWSAVQTDIDNLKAAVADHKPEEIFMTAASPGIIANFLPNEHYPDHEAYLYALADVMKDEYRAIVQAGFLLQVDCPDLALTRVSSFAHLSLDAFKDIVAMHVEVLNYAVADLPPERLRMHLCWGNTEGPHHRDVPLDEIVHLVLNARPMAISFEGANPRHAHEWKVWQTVELPADKVIIPGVVDTTTNFIEHPELVAERIVRYADVVGRERVIASTDCGFGTSAWGRKVDARIAWAKLASLTEGARLASGELFGG
ncbi:cobalamin-independent methionine synthase II family protein [Candidatus Entotheonella palauensis]|uniref:cobalamin-independent methionine synthase II family protein n=1 Tax=Candidatus Entotheonella palauensis TaxID=93172 RepID=UPI000B7EFDAB|nr:cobalamin-independent methionine synthase II family protein [Candidatus Entotheonella palauensis]